jgi:hypothetical protein
MHLHLRTAPEDGDRHRRARARVGPNLWERSRPVLGWTLAALAAALLYAGMRGAFEAASKVGSAAVSRR